MLLIDFNSKPRPAFTHGFLKGLGAPVVLFGGLAMPHIPLVQQVVPPGQFSTIAGDWAKIGDDIRAATAAYGKEASAK